MTQIRTTTNEAGEKLYSLRDVAIQLGMTSITPLLPHIAPVNRHMRSCGRRSPLIFVPRASLNPFQDRLDFNGVKPVASWPGSKSKPKRNNQMIRTIVHPETGETLYALSDIARQLNLQSSQVHRAVPTAKLLKARLGTSHELSFAARSSLGPFERLINFDQATTPVDIGGSFLQQLLNTKVRKIEHEKHPDCWEPLSEYIMVPDQPGPQSLRRVLYTMITGVELPVGVSKLRPRKHCWATLVPGGKRQISCCNPDHQSLVQLQMRPKTGDQSSISDLHQELLLELLTDHKPLGEWTEDGIREFAKDYALIPSEAIEAVINNHIMEGRA